MSREKEIMKMICDSKFSLEDVTTKLGLNYTEFLTKMRNVSLFTIDEVNTLINMLHIENPIKFFLD